MQKKKKTQQTTTQTNKQKNHQVTKRLLCQKVQQMFLVTATNCYTEDFVKPFVMCPGFYMKENKREY